MAKREYYYCINLRPEPLAIGDLKKIPVLQPKVKVDLLQWYPKYRLQQSANLKSMCKKGWLDVTIHTDGRKRKVSKSNPGPYLSSAEEDEIGTKIWGRNVSSEIPQDGDILTWDGTDNRWEPQAGENKVFWNVTTITSSPYDVASKDVYLLAYSSSQSSHSSSSSR